ncbi:MAG: SlyX family protein [Alcanivoracaceae bacterium]|nr:SlyX family protein [Alcanivoracaceae bacterium]
MSDINNKLIEIETKIAFQEQTIEQLNEVIIQQQKSIDALQRQLRQLNNKIEEESQHWSQDQTIIDEKPPHY